jgi:two-component system, cell cycle sensor histidine kinase and response regulator CckA
MIHGALPSETARLKVVIVEDSEEDADLILLELKRGGYNPISRRVETADDMRQALDEGQWDLVLADFSMPRLTLTEALSLTRECSIDLSFVIVSAAIGEETAVEAMKAGANDFVLKHRLTRLVPVVQRELRESAVRRERRELEEQLRCARELESLGILAGGVAHDFNNLLTGILGFASQVLDLTPSDAPTADMLRHVIGASERAADLTRQLLAYAGKGKFVVGPVNLSELVRKTSDLIRSTVPRNVSLEVNLQNDIPMVEADATQIQQLVMNLILNAAEAASDRSGEVRIATGVCAIAPGETVTQYRPEAPPPGSYVMLRVSDDGCGMNEIVKAKIFDPFFTTKFTGRGLGLSAALGIVRSHRGAIDVASGEGEGSTFTVLLPALAAASARIEAVKPAREMETPESAAILVIDDEEVVRRAARVALEHAGYTVFEASSGPDGADLFTRVHDRISAVLLDLTMPRMDGREVRRCIRRIRADMKIIISSGYEESYAMKQFSDDPSLTFLKKPYTAQRLVGKMREVLDQGSAVAGLGY